jgi:uncharacterized membrane protein HdeD (DUF308 family)
MPGSAAFSFGVNTANFGRNSTSQGGSGMAQEGLSNVTSGSSTIWAILLIVLGFLAIVLPFATSWGVVVVLAWLIIFSGIFQFIHAFQSKGVGHILWKLLVAALYLIVGIYYLMHPLMGVAALTLALAIFFVLEGIFDIVEYFQVRRLIGSGWILFDGIVTLILGILVWRHWPSSSVWVIGTLVGISMIMTGITRLMTGFAVRRLERA